MRESNLKSAVVTSLKDTLKQKCDHSEEILVTGCTESCHSNLTNPTMHPFHIPQCTIQNRNVYISVLNGALWDMELLHCGICEWGPHSPCCQVVARQEALIGHAIVPGLTCRPAAHGTCHCSEVPEVGVIVRPEVQIVRYHQENLNPHVQTLWKHRVFSAHHDDVINYENIFHVTGPLCGEFTGHRTG